MGTAHSQFSELLVEDTQKDFCSSKFKRRQISLWILCSTPDYISRSFLSLFFQQVLHSSQAHV